jgi:NAD(P)-dependent dehydrogenase (short-subunit alcohol dehydrogenase family)
VVDPQPARNVLVTGAAKRVGRGIALHLARHGWGVAVHYGTSKVSAGQVVAEIEAMGGRAVAVQADLGREEEAEALVPRAAEMLGSLTCLVNNASVFEPDEALDVTRRSWDFHMAINLRAPFVLTQCFARYLSSGLDGNVVNMIDERVWDLTPHFMSYTVSKAALWTLTRTLALALAPRIRVNAIGPGPVLPSIHQTRESFQRLCETMPLRRGTTPDEIGRAIRFLLDAPAVTGQMIALDGGQHLGWLLPEQDVEIAQS